MSNKKKKRTNKRAKKPGSRPRGFNKGISEEAAFSHLQSGRISQAEQVFREIRNIQPADARAHNNLGIILQIQGRLDEATECYHRALEIDPNFENANLNLGTTMRLQGKLDDAAERFKHIVEINPHHIEAYNELGVTLRGQAKLEEAAACFESAITINPNYAEAHNNLGNVLQDQNEPNEAVVSFERALKINPGYAEAHNNLGAALMTQDRLKDAAFHFQRTIELKPDLAEAYNNMGTILSQQRDFDKAALNYEKAIALRPDYAEAYLNYANVLKSLDRREEAIKYFRSFLELRPDDPEATYLLAAYLGEKTGPAPAKYISKLFDTYAENFDQNLIENLQYKGPQLLREAVGRVSGLETASWRVLDLGCGTGLCGALFRDLASHLSGVDLTPRMLEKALKRGIYDHLQSGELMDALRREEKTLDLIISTDVFTYVGDLTRVFAACRNALREGGLLHSQPNPPKERASPSSLTLRDSRTRLCISNLSHRRMGSQ